MKQVSEEDLKVIKAVENSLPIIKEFEKRCRLVYNLSNNTLKAETNNFRQQVEKYY